MFGEFGWEWIKLPEKTHNTLTSANNDEADLEQSAKPPPAARRSLDNEFQPQLPPRAPGNVQPALLPTAGSYVDKSVSASPLSDVTCSQSPSKVSVQPAPKRAVTFTRPETVDENEEEDPIMEIMRQNLEKKKKNKPQVKAAADSSLVASNRNETANAKMEIDDDDPLEIQRRLSLEKAQDPLEIARLKQEKERSRRNAELESDDDDDGPFKVAKNPFALMEQNSARRSFSPQDNHVARRPQKPAADLWDDSDEEEPKPDDDDEKEGSSSTEEWRNEKVFSCGKEEGPGGQKEGYRPSRLSRGGRGQRY